MAAATRAEGEKRVWDAFMSGAYHGFGCCRNPRCESPRSVVLTVGRSASARVCVFCFEFDFDCVHPSLRKLTAMGRRS